MVKATVFSVSVLMRLEKQTRYWPATVAMMVKVPCFCRRAL